MRSIQNNIAISCVVPINSTLSHRLSHRQSSLINIAPSIGRGCLLLHGLPDIGNALMSAQLLSLATRRTKIAQFIQRHSWPTLTSIGFPESSDQPQASQFHGFGYVHMFSSRCPFVQGSGCLSVIAPSHNHRSDAGISRSRRRAVAHTLDGARAQLKDARKPGRAGRSDRRSAVAGRSGSWPL